MSVIRFAEERDKDFWFELDEHISYKEFQNKVKDKRAYIILIEKTPIGILRYNLFWDSIPFCTMLFIKDEYQGKGYGHTIMSHWENEMKKMNYDLVMTSTQVDENAQHFYRKLGYQECGSLILTVPNHEQPMEMFLNKSI